MSLGICILTNPPDNSHFQESCRIPAYGMPTRRETLFFTLSCYYILMFFSPQFLLLGGGGWRVMLKKKHPKFNYLEIFFLLILFFSGLV